MHALGAGGLPGEGYLRWATGHLLEACILVTKLRPASSAPPTQ